MVCLIFNTSTSPNKIILDDQVSYTTDELHWKAQKYLELLFGYNDFNFYLLCNGKLLCNESVEGNSSQDVYVIPRLLGGKGGFGSMLRAIGAQIEKTTNREACRDLSGRRLRDINEEKRLKKWIAEQAEREQEALKRKRKKLEKLNEEIKHEFNDEEYTKARLEMPEKIHEAVEQGFKAATEELNPSKEANIAKKSVSSKKKLKGNFWVDDLLDDSDGSELDESEEELPKKKIKLS